MKILKGISVSSGIAIGKVQIVERQKLKISRNNIKEHEVDNEVLKFENSLQNVVADIDYLIDNLSHSQDNKDILETHKMILRDPELEKKIKKLINFELISLEKAIEIHFSDIKEIFKNMENDYYSQRFSDYDDVAYRLLSHVLQQEDKSLDHIEENSILVMRNISPTLVTKVFAKNISGLCMEKGSRNSHSSIIARSMNLPMVVNIHQLLSEISENEIVILNGDKGEIILNPNPKTLEKYKKTFLKQIKDEQKLLEIKNKKTITKDGKYIKLMSNIEIPEEISQVQNVKSKGIGLFRTEFLFMDTNELPSENKQYKIYKEIAEKCYPESVVIRTMDIGGDKLSNILNIEHEENPNLGCRGIRISLRYNELFKTQINAILRANIVGNIKIMFPMISCVAEVKKIKKIIQECSKSLKNKKERYNSNIEIGAMIEIPSAAVTSDLIAQECDFLSIGTNDLVQYTLAVDRDNSSVEEYYQPTDLAVLRLIKMTVDNAHKENIKVALCGEMASEKKYIPLLLGLGIDEFSVSPGRLLAVKNEIRKTDYQEAKNLHKKIFQGLSEN